MPLDPMKDTCEDAVDLYWLPLGAGAGNQVVRLSGRLYERLAAWRGRRPPQALYHSALRVRRGEENYMIEMAPVWSHRSNDRGSVCLGAVGLPMLGRSRLFRYEVRRWRDGVIDDIAHAVESPRRLSADREHAERVLANVPAFPTATWGLDELGTGEMWNSNSLVSWLLAVSGHDRMRSCLPPEVAPLGGTLAWCGRGSQPGLALEHELLEGLLDPVRQHLQVGAAS